MLDWFESLPLKTTTSRLLAGLPSLKKITSDAPLMSSPGFVKFARVYVASPVTRVVTFARYALESVKAQQLAELFPMFTPVMGVPLKVTLALLSLPPPGPCQ